MKQDDFLQLTLENENHVHYNITMGWGDHWSRLGLGVVKQKSQSQFFWGPFKMMTFNVVLSGKGELKLKSGRTLAMQSGFSYFADPSQPWEEHRVDIGPEGLVELYLCFDQGTMEGFKKLNILPSEHYFQVPHLGGILNSFYNLWQYGPQKMLDRRGEVVIPLTELLVHLQKKSLRSYGKQAHSDWVFKVCQWIEDEPASRKSFPDMAQELHVDYHILRREFKREMGQSLGEYRIAQRIVRARILLEKHNVGEVAELLGYGEPFTFSAQFKRSTGLAPQQYRKQL